MPDAQPLRDQTICPICHKPAVRPFPAQQRDQSNVLDRARNACIDAAFSERRGDDTHRVIPYCSADAAVHTVLEWLLFGFVELACTCDSSHVDRDGNVWHGACCPSVNPEVDGLVEEIRRLYAATDPKVEAAA